MFDKVLIANRGEVAVRVIRACRDMGIKTAAVYSTADADALHVQLADEAYCIGGPRLAESYLNDDAVLTCAVKSGGKGDPSWLRFLFREGEFRARLRQVRPGVCWSLGRGHRHSMGDKDAARRTAAAAGVPIVPGCDLLKSPEEATAEAERIGCPVLIKARAGGGGRGIRKVERVEDAAKAFIEARAEGEAVFGDGEVLWRSLSRRRITLRCRLWPISRAMCFRLASVSARCSAATKKLIEESPAPCLDGHDDIRARMHKAARDLARASRLRRSRYHRVPVFGRRQFLLYGNEHALAGGASGYGVCDRYRPGQVGQLRVAAGQPLPFEQEDMPVRNHAMECRINAENAGLSAVMRNGHRVACARWSARALGFRHVYRC